MSANNSANRDTEKHLIQVELILEVTQSKTSSWRPFHKKTACRAICTWVMTHDIKVRTVRFLHNIQACNDITGL